VSARPRPPFDLIIFDNDGVLVDSEWLANGILADLFCEAGLPSTREGCIAEYMGSTMARVREIAERRLGRPLPADLEDRYHERLFDAFRTSLTAVPGVAEVLAQLATPTCVASSGTHERIRLALTTTGLLPRFDGRIFSAQDVARQAGAGSVPARGEEPRRPPRPLCRRRGQPAGRRSGESGGDDGLRFCAHDPARAAGRGGRRCLSIDGRAPGVARGVPMLCVRCRHQRRKR
jgi:hypothetical protein